jgi:hypothetical protein
MGIDLDHRWMAIAGEGVSSMFEGNCNIGIVSDGFR